MGDAPIRLLLVEDDEVDQMAFKRFVRSAELAYDYRVAGSVAAAGREMAAGDFDIVVADYMLTDGTLFDLMEHIGGIPVIVTTGAGDEQTAVEAMKLGARDYLIKDNHGQYLKTLAYIVESTLKYRQVKKELEHYQEHLEELVKKRTARLEVELRVRNRVEAALRNSEKQLRAILMSAQGFAVYRLARVDTASHKLRVEFLSPSLKDILGVAPDTFTPELFFKNVHPDDIERVAAANTRAFETNQFNETCRVWHPLLDDWRWIQAFSHGVKNDAGEITHVNGIFLDVTEKALAQQALEEKARDLERANIALNVVLQNRQEDRNAQEKNVRSNINSLIFPSLDHLAQSKLNEHQKVHLDIARTSLREVLSSFSRNLSSSFLSLSPTEIQVANFIKHGKSSKEIAQALHVSPKTIKNHRQSIRAKMGLKNQKMNLRTYLLSLE
jgi:DNA-binding NarL/FixJ family response regulator